MCDYHMLDCCPQNCPCACTFSNAQPRNGLQSCMVELCEPTTVPKVKVSNNMQRTRGDSSSPANNKWQGSKDHKPAKKYPKKTASRLSINAKTSNSKVGQPSGKGGKKFNNKSYAPVITNCACPKPTAEPPAEQKVVVTCKACEDTESEDSSSSIPETYVTNAKKCKQTSLTSTNKINQNRTANDMSLDEMQRCIEQVLRAYFMHTMEKIECLSTQLLRNECMVAKLHLDVVERISKLNERSLNQFQVLSDRVSRLAFDSPANRREFEKSFWSSESTKDEFQGEPLNQKEEYPINDFDNLNTQHTAAPAVKNNSKIDVACYCVQQDQVLGSTISVISVKNKSTDVDKFPTQHMQAKRPRRAFPIKAQPSLESVAEEAQVTEYAACEQRVQELQQELECSKQELKRSMKRLQQFKQREEMQLESRESKLCNMLTKLPCGSFDSNKMPSNININSGASNKDSKKPQPNICTCASQSKVAAQQELKQRTNQRQNSKQDHSNVQYVCCPNLSQRNRKQSKNRNR